MFQGHKYRLPSTCLLFHIEQLPGKLGRRQKCFSLYRKQEFRAQTPVKIEPLFIFSVCTIDELAMISSMQRRQHRRKNAGRKWLTKGGGTRRCVTRSYREWSLCDANVCVHVFFQAHMPNVCHRQWAN